MSGDSRDLNKLEKEFRELKNSLIKMGRELAANQWFCSGTYEPSPSDRIQEAVARAKADIGEKLLEALGAEPNCKECRGEDGEHEVWCDKRKKRSR